MDTPADLIFHARTSARLTIRALAHRAHVSASTVSRIESGAMDPTVGMLRRLLESAGQDLTMTTTASDKPRLASLADAWNDKVSEGTIDWTRIRAFLDYLDQSPELIPQAIAEAPPHSGSALLDNLLAGIAETLSSENSLEFPDWCAKVPALESHWITPGTPRMQQQAGLSTPLALAARGITLARTSLWRERVDA